MSRFNKMVLLNSSSNADVQYVGGEILINGLDPIKQTRVVDFSQINYRAEVVQVVTIGNTSYTPVGSTTYKVLIGDPNRRDQGMTDFLKEYKFTTVSDVTTYGNAAAQREAIHVGIVAAINQISTNWCVAATLGGGTGFTVTDDAGYYPYNRQGMTNRKGANIVKAVANTNGSGFTALDTTLTTAAVYSVGVGLNLQNSAAVYDLVTGNLIAGDIDYPKVYGTNAVAVSGQKYNMFNISYLADVAIPTVGGSSTALMQRYQQIWVDNGAGTATTNLAGYITFERAMHRGIAVKYSNDSSALAEFFDNNFIIQGALGAVVVATANLKNKFLTGYANMFNHYNIGAQTIVAPSQGATGLLIEQDATATEGAHYCAEVGTAAPKEFIVGKTDITFLFKASATTVANIVLLAGLRKKEAYAADFNDYTEMVAAGTGAAGTAFSTYGILANAATVATATGTNAVDATLFTIRINVNKAGLCAVYINDVKVNVYSAGTTALVVPAGTVLIPFFQYTNLNSAAAVPNVTELLALPGTGIFA